MRNIKGTTPNIKGRLQSLYWTSGLDWWTHPNCSKNAFFSVGQKLIQPITVHTSAGLYHESVEVKGHVDNN